MVTRFNHIACGAAALLLAASVSQAQLTPAAPGSSSLDSAHSPPASNPSLKPSAGSATDASSMMLVQASTATVPPAGVPTAPTAATPTTSTTSATTPTEVEPAGDTGGVGVREFQGDE